MEVNIYSDKAKSQTGDIWVKIYNDNTTRPKAERLSAR